MSEYELQSVPDDGDILFVVYLKDEPKQESLALLILDSKSKATPSTSVFSLTVGTFFVCGMWVSTNNPLITPLSLSSLQQG